MNNSKIAIHSLELEEKIDLTPAWAQKEAEMTEIVDALEHISGSNYWKMLVQKLFSKDFQSLQKQLRNEKNPTEIYRLQGRLHQAEKLDLNKELQVRKLELKNLRSKIDANN